ncbi:error-prone DNA polymerase [Mumia flava]|uniref:Error-prone DNA polymerase n=1 Tax=Mumia flava TaxID=1348852 RepID=A0A0B2AYF2_9ACTN|nr:error-prone DNA polymerase [Mumia flava]PJJ54144.1 error-prone DNA polymerase [Mumia flava]
MGFNNPDMPWSELERRLSGRLLPHERAGFELDGGDGPGTSRKRGPYEPPAVPDTHPDEPYVGYAELHAHSDFSFLDGASSPEALVEEAVRLRLSALALADHDGLYGVVRMAEAADLHGMPTVFGAELSLGLRGPQNGIADPEGSHLLVLARGQEGYHRLSATLTDAHLAGGEKGRPVYDLDAVAERLAGHAVVLTGCRKGAVRQALAGPGGEAAAETETRALVERFGSDAVLVELSESGDPRDAVRNDALAAIAARCGLDVVAAGNVHAATPTDRRLAHAVAAVRARRSLADMDGWLPAAGAHLRSGAEMARAFARWPGAVERTVDVAADLAFELRRAKPRLPKQQVPDGHTPMTWLRELVRRGADQKYAGAPASTYERLEAELAVIEEKDFPGYFLIVHDIVAFARRRGILCQGRGSAANSAVCYALGITAVDSVKFDLPFERFLSATRDEEPDIDVDFDSDRREEVIQWVYATYGRHNAAQVANVISYRPKSAVRDMAKALGYSTGQQDAWSKRIDRWGTLPREELAGEIPDPVLDLADQLLTAPRHLGIHSGGMVLTDRPVGEVCPVEHARMEDRTVLQWDKDDCAWMGLVKFDLLGLGMLGAIQHCFDVVAEHVGERWELATIPKEEPGVYDQLCRGDSVGVFQVESRAQIGTLPRLRPRCFYDLVTEIALIRPGPIQGGAVHPYIRRRTGEEEISYLHPALEPVLKRTLGVPLFQEQLMQIAMQVGGCTGDEADLLRRAMGSKRGVEKIERLRATLYAGMASHGITGELADEIYLRIEAFASFGFAESHSISFALLVYASTWLRLHYPGAFLVGLLRAQPMGFYSPASLVTDARHHGVEVLRPDINASVATAADLEAAEASGSGGSRSSLRSASTTGSGGNSASTNGSSAGRGASGASDRDPSGHDACLVTDQPPVGDFDPDAPFDHAWHRRDGRFVVRLGLTSVTSIGTGLAERIVAERERGGPYASMTDLTRRVPLTAPQVEALATAGAFDGFGLSRRQALWSAGAASQESPDQLEGTTALREAPMLPGMSPAETTMADLWATSIAPDSHPIEHVREAMTVRGVLRVADLAHTEPGLRIEVAGLVTHRQRPATAGGVTFLNLEDETGMLNVICTAGLWARYRRIARDSSALVVRGLLERRDGAANLHADRLERLPITARTTSRDFR